MGLYICIRLWTSLCTSVCICIIIVDCVLGFVCAKCLEFFVVDL